MAVARRMLLALFALALLFTLTPEAHAQVSLTINVGMSFASLEGDDVEEEFGTSRDLMGGIHLGFPVSDVFSVAPGLYYVQKGAEATEGNVEVSLDLTYIEIPVLGVFSLTGPDRPVGVSVFLGPSFGIEASCKFEVEVGDELDESEDCDDDPDNDERRKLDIGAVFGAGVSFPLTGRLSAVVNGGLDMGLRSLDSSAEKNDIKNQMWFLTVGVAFPLGG